MSRDSHDVAASLRGACARPTRPWLQKTRRDLDDDLYSPARALVEPAENFFRPRSEASLVVFVAGLAREFRECWISVNCRCNCSQADAGFHRKHKLMQQIAGVWPDHGCAENFIGASCGQYFDETSVFALDHCTVEIFQRNNKQIVFDIFLFRLLFAETDVRDLWISVSAPGHDRIIHFLPQQLEGNADVP